MFEVVDIIGVIGGILVIICLLPQLITIIKNKSAKDVSLIMYIILFIGQILWTVYGILKNDLQVMITNIISGIITMIIILCAIYFNGVSNVS
jgi:MtN3 and saliva related transmembrane protein